MRPKQKYKRVYVASPLRAQNDWQKSKNIAEAKSLSNRVSSELGCGALAPHAWLPFLLDDNVPEERDMALQIDRLLLELCDALIVCGDRVSEGMQLEIDRMRELGKPVFRRNGAGQYEEYV